MKRLTKNYHVIKRVKFDVEIDDEEKAHTTHDAFKQLYEQKFLDIIERIFSKYSTPNFHIRIDELVLDLGEYQAGFSEQQLVDKFSKVLEQTLKAKLAAHLQQSDLQKARKLSKTDADLEVLLYFLKHGRLPNDSHSEATVLDEMLSNQLELNAQNFIFHLNRLTLSAIRRLVYQFTAELLHKLIRAIQPLYFQRILDQIDIYNNFYSRIFPNYIPIKNTLYEHTIIFLLKYRSGVFDLNQYRKEVISEALLDYKSKVLPTEKVHLTILEHYFYYKWLPNWLHILLRTFLQKLSPQQIQAIQQLSVQTNYSSFAFSNLSDDWQQDIHNILQIEQTTTAKDVKKILLQFFKTGVLPKWSAKDTLIFEHWLIDNFHKQPTLVRQLLHQQDSDLLRMRLTGMLTLQGLQELLRLWNLELFQQVANYLQQQLNNDKAIEQTALTFRVFETAFDFFPRKNHLKQRELIPYLNKVIFQHEVSGTSARWSNFLQNGQLDLTKTDFEDWLLKQLKTNKKQILQRLRANNKPSTIEQLLNTFTLDGVLTIIRSIDLKTHDLIQKYFNHLSLTTENKRVILKNTFQIILEHQEIPHNEVEQLLIDLLEKRAYSTKNLPKYAQIKQRNLEDSLNYILEEGKFPFWLTTQNADLLLLDWIDQSPDAVRAFFKRQTPTNQAQQHLITLFSDVALNQLLNLLYPNFFGFINTIFIAFEKMIQKQAIDSNILGKKQYHLKEIIWRYAFNQLHQSFNLNGFLTQVIKHIAQRSNTKASIIYDAMLQVVEQAIQNGETRFFPLKTLLPANQKQILGSSKPRIIHNQQKTISDIQNKLFIKLLTNKGIRLTVFSIEHLNNEYPRQLQIALLEYYFLYGSFPIEFIKNEITIDEIIKNSIKNQAIVLKQIFKKYVNQVDKLDGLVKILSKETFQYFLEIFDPSSSFINYAAITTKLFVNKSIDNQVISLTFLKRHQLQYLIMIKNTLFTPFHYVQNMMKMMSRTYRIDYKNILNVLRNNIDKVPQNIQQELTDIEAALRLKIPKRYQPVPKITQQEPHRTWQIPEAEKEIFIDNAGLVLVHPLLAFCFKSLKLTAPNKQFKDAVATERAVHILQYISTKQEQCSETELALNKILCGLSVNAPIRQQVVLTEEEKAWSEELLKVVVKQWKVIKNTTPDGLRNSFLKRNGRLMKKDANWVLRVEQKPYDLLVEKLPWMLSTVKLPWMEHALYVEWR